MYKKVALTVLLISLALLAVGIFIFVDKQGKDNAEEAGSKPAASQDKNQPAGEKNAAGSAGVGSENNGNNGVVIDWDKRLAELEAEISDRIKIKYNKMVKNSDGRRYTADELEFQTAPRLYIINEMETNGEITAEAVTKLKANQE